MKGLHGKLRDAMDRLETVKKYKEILSDLRAALLIEQDILTGIGRSDIESREATASGENLQSKIRKVTYIS